MSTLAIRDIPADILRAVKVHAAKNDLTIKECVIAAILEFLQPRVPVVIVEPTKAPDERTVTRYSEERSVKANLGMGTSLHRGQKHAANCKCFICKPPKP